MADILVLRGAQALRRVSFHLPQRPCETYDRTAGEMAEPDSAPVPIPKSRSEGNLTDNEVEFTPDGATTPSLSSSPENVAPATPTMMPKRLSRNPSFSNSSSYQEDWDIPPLDRLTVLDILDNFALPQQLEKISKGISAQTEKLRKSREVLKNRSQMARERMVEEWRQRVPSADEQLDRYRKRMRSSVEKLGRQWNDTKAITLREKVSFICGVLNIFISGYIIGGWPQYMYLWYTAQILYFMPIRYYTYHRRGYTYFLADLCYFVNLLLILSIWVFPNSKRLLVAVYCLAYGNNAVAIVMWRNSLVFHSFDKVTSLFIHVMPCATLHCMVHLLDPELQRRQFPAIWNVKQAPPGSPTAYANVVSMLAWSTLPYAVWQLSYYFFITVRRREKIVAGRPTSFTWLLRSYSRTWIGKVVLGLPGPLQEPAFMLIQYFYAVLTTLPCPLWFYSRWASAGFLMVVFTWSIYNGSTYYIDVFGKRFQKELEAMKAEVAKMASPESFAGLTSPGLTPMTEKSGEELEKDMAARDARGVDSIPLLGDEKHSVAEVLTTGADLGARDMARGRKAAETDGLPAL